MSLDFSSNHSVAHRADPLTAAIAEAEEGFAICGLCAQVRSRTKGHDSAESSVTSGGLSSVDFMRLLNAP